MIKKQSSIDFNSATKRLNIINPNLLFGMQTTKWRRSIEKIDLLFLTLEALDVNTSQSFELIARDLEMSHVFPNYVAIWKSRCHNPLRRSSSNSTLSIDSFEGLIKILSSMSNQFYPRIRELLTSKGSTQYRSERWNKFCLRLEELITERMNVRRGLVKKYLIRTSNSDSFHKQLLLILALSSGPGGLKRLSSSIFEPLL